MALASHHCLKAGLLQRDPENAPLSRTPAGKGIPQGCVPNTDSSRESFTLASCAYLSDHRDHETELQCGDRAVAHRRSDAAMSWLTQINDSQGLREQVGHRVLLHCSPKPASLAPTPDSAAAISEDGKRPAVAARFKGANVLGHADLCANGSWGHGERTRHPFISLEESPSGLDSKIGERSSLPKWRCRGSRQESPSGPDFKISERSSLPKWRCRGSRQTAAAFVSKDGNRRAVAAWFHTWMQLAVAEIGVHHGRVSGLLMSSEPMVHGERTRHPLISLEESPSGRVSKIGERSSLCKWRCRGSRQGVQGHRGTRLLQAPEATRMYPQIVLLTFREMGGVPMSRRMGLPIFGEPFCDDAASSTVTLAEDERGGDQRGQGAAPAVTECIQCLQCSAAQEGCNTARGLHRVPFSLWPRCPGLLEHGGGGHGAAEEKCPSLPARRRAEGDRTGSQGDIFSGGAETGKAGGARGRPGLSEHLQRAWGGAGADAGLPAGSAEEIRRAQERPSLGGLDGVGGGTGGRQAPSRHLIIHRNSRRSGILAVSGRASAWPGPERRGQESGKEGQYAADGVTRGRARGRGWRAPEGLSQQGGCSGPGLWTQHSCARYCGPGAGAERAHSGLVHAVCPNRSAPGSGMARQDSTRGVKGMGQSQTRQGRRGRVSAISGEGGRGAGRARPGYRWRAARYRPPEPTAKAGLTGSDRGATGASHARTGGEARSPAGVDGPVSLKGQDVSAMNLLERYDMVRCDGEGRGETAVQLSGTTWLAPQAGSSHNQRLFLSFSEGAHTHTAALWAHPSPSNPPDEQKWCYPAHVWAFESGDFFKSV
ncbi:uncharacterized protein [Dipodomys merriami]|uniref:uncharacterized protein n=1 Tax=Dipodomys merriami TaxID=94247 RepID=UPI003855876F